MEENNTTSEFDNRIESILNAASEKENARKNHWWNDICPCVFISILFIGYIIFMIILMMLE